ncbi:MAG TPA: DUF11 domain-containing protein, partial [Thermoanaerobaculia bacterium]
MSVDIVVPNGVTVVFACTSSTIGIGGTPATNRLMLEASNNMGSGGNTINVTGGELDVNAGATLPTGTNSVLLNPGKLVNSGAISVQSGGSLLLSASNTTNNGTITVDPNGTLTMTAGGSLVNNVANGITIKSLASAGTPGQMTWNSGLIRGPGSILVQSGLTPGNLTLSGTTGGMILDTGQLISNSGTTTYSSVSNQLTLDTNAQIDNSGTFSLSTDTGIGSDLTGKITNTGTFRKTGGSGTTIINAIFDNNGTVTFTPASVGMAFNNGGTHGGLFQMPLSNTFSFDGVHNFNSGAAFGGAGTVSITGGTFQANTGLTIPGNVNNAGSLTFGGVTRTFTINGNYAQTAIGALTVRLNGTTPGSQFDVVNVANAVTLNGTLNASLNFAAANGQTFDIITDSTVSGDFQTKNLTACCGLSLQEIPSPPSGTQVRLQAVAQADMTMLKTGPASVLNGQNATFTVKVGNGGPNAATNVVVTDVFSGGTYVSATPTGTGSCTGTSSPFTCNWATIPSGGTEFVTVKLKAVGAPGPLNNTASVTANESDPVPGNNSMLVSVTVNPAADLSITGVSGLPNPVNAGASETWQVGVNNAGPDAASNVAVNISVASGTIISASGPGFTCSNTAST